MPTATFFHLPQTKRQRVMEAVWQEFTSVSYMEASINRIIQTAEISRGSFYQYFSGKPDLFAYLLQTVLQTGEEMFQAQLTAHSNDLFTALLGMYDTLLWKESRQGVPERDRFRHLVRLNRDLDPGLFAQLLDLQTMTDKAMALLADSGYPAESPLRCRAVIQMLLSVGLCALNSSVRFPEQSETNRRLLAEQLAVIRQGLMAKGDSVC